MEHYESLFLSPLSNVPNWFLSSLVGSSPTTTMRQTPFNIALRWNGGCCWNIRVAMLKATCYTYFFDKISHIHTCRAGQTVVTFSVSIKLRLVSLLKKAETFEMSQMLAIFERCCFYSYELFSQLSMKISHLTARASKGFKSVSLITAHQHIYQYIFSTTTPLALIGVIGKN